jgi:hypothetical protein
MMKRALLISAMAFSLWPVWAILLLGNGHQEPPANRERAFLRHSKPSPARPRLERIATRVHALNEDLADAELTAGQPQYDLAFRAHGIEEELQRWRARSRGEATRSERRVARRLIDLMQAVTALAENPSQRTLRRYNRDRRRFNRAIRGG